MKMQIYYFLYNLSVFHNKISYLYVYKTNDANMIVKNRFNFFNKPTIWLVVFLIIFLYPFYCPLITQVTGYKLSELYTFGLLRNEFMLVWIALGGIIGIIVTVEQTQKRIFLQEQQQESQRVQFQTQNEKQDKQLLDNRFSSCVELLGNPKESARIGCAYNLYFLADECPEDYLHPICEILCAHIRTMTNEKTYQEKYREKPSNEMQTVLNLLFQKDRHDNLIFEKCFKNLEGAFLGGFVLSNTILSNVNFRSATLSIVDFESASFHKVDFVNASLRNVNFNSAELYNVNFMFSSFSYVGFYGASLSQVDFRHVKLSDVDFWNAKLKDKNNFKETVLEKYSHEEIIRPGRSFEITKSQK